MDPINALKLAAAAQGLPPDMVDLVIDKLTMLRDDLVNLVRSATEANQNAALDSKLSTIVKLSGIAGCEDLAGMLLEEVRAELQPSDEEEPEEEPLAFLGAPTA